MQPTRSWTTPSLSTLLSGISSYLPDCFWESVPSPWQKKEFSNYCITHPTVLQDFSLDTIYIYIRIIKKIDILPLYHSYTNLISQHSHMSMLPLSSNVHSENEILEAICQGTKMPNFIKPRANSVASNSPPYGCMMSPLERAQLRNWRRRHMHVRSRNLCLILLFPTLHFIHEWMEQKGCLQPSQKHKGNTQTFLPRNTKMLIQIHLNFNQVQYLLCRGLYTSFSNQPEWAQHFLQKLTRYYAKSLVTLVTKVTNPWEIDLGPLLIFALIPFLTNAFPVTVVLVDGSEKAATVRDPMAKDHLSSCKAVKHGAINKKILRVGTFIYAVPI